MTGVVEVIVAGAGAAASAAAAASPWIAGASALASAGLAISGSRQQAAATIVQAGQQRVVAQQQDLAARQEEVRGQQQANAIRENMLRTLAAQNARYAAAGLAIGEGSPLTVADETRREAEMQLTIGGANAQARAAAARAGAAGTRMGARLLEDRADGIQTAGLITAGTGLFDAFDRQLARVPGRRVAPGGAAA